MAKLYQICSILSLIFVISVVHAQDSLVFTDTIASIAGDVEIVFDWTTDRCDDEDIPDLPARAFRDSGGQVNLITTHFIGRRYIGTSLNELNHDCDIIADSVYSADPAQYSDKEWLASLYTVDGETIYALQHNEYQGHTHSGQCPSGDYFSCWYNSITLAISTDAGASYSNIASPPNHLVAALPYSYEAEAGPYGVFEPSNMLFADDGYIYAFIRIDDYQSERQWVCLMRTDDIAVPSSWRTWNGLGFELEFINPYLNPVDNPRAQLCSPIAENEIGVMHESLTYNTYLDHYVLVGLSADRINGREVWGIYYSFSDDLIHWSHRQLLMETELPWTYTRGDNDPILYPSLLDPDSDSRNFSTTDQTAYLYFTQFNYNNGQMNLDRDLVRVPIEFNVLTIDAPQYEFELVGSVPQDATRALVGYRINTECDCSGSVTMNLHALQYGEGDSGRNLVPNSLFTNALANWNISGDATYDIQPSTLSDGQMLSLTANAPESSALNSAVFDVTANEEFTLSVIAETNDVTQDAGYFTLIFLDDISEIQRERIPIISNSTES